MKHWYAIGMMSGTSLDGIDLVYVKFWQDQTYHFEIICGETISYTDEWKLKLKNAFHSSAVEITALHATYGIYIGQVINDFIHRNSINNLDFIASHGHTIFHNPTEHYTLQIGSGTHIAAVTQQTVICDFRTQDVAFGGQGAPLVPIGDELLFSNFDYCLNIGGFANISFQKNKQRMAYDVVPANIVLNYLAEKLGFPYDDKGKIASSGIIIPTILEQFNQMSLYENKRSMGYEQVEQLVFPILNSTTYAVQDLLRTYTEHIALKITNEINAHKSVLITGGGAYHDFLIERIRNLSHAELHIPNRETIDFKEALIFAFLGLLRIENQVNCLQSVTKAKKDHSSGVIFYP